MTLLLYIAETLLGPPTYHTSVPGQAYWHCPFHDDASPSFRTQPHNPAYKDYWRCDGCARFGDVYNLLRLLRELGHPLARGGYDDHQWMVARWRAEYDAAAPHLNGGKETTPPGASPADLPGSRRQRDAGDVSSSPLSRGCTEQQCQAYAAALHATTGADLMRLTELRGPRGFAPETSRRHGLAWDRSGGCWLIPHRGAGGGLVSLLRYYPDGRKLWVRGTPQVLFGVDRLAGDDRRAGKTLFVVEGALDAIAVDAQLLRCKASGAYDVLGLPGAGAFRPEWVRHLDGYAAVRLCLDNDDAGRAGQERVAGVASEAKVRSRLYALNWPAGTPPKTDVGDLVRDGVSVVNFTRDHCAAVPNGMQPTKSVQPRPRP